MKTKTATKVILCCSLNQTADSRWQHICRAYAADKRSYASIDIGISDICFHYVYHVAYVNILTLI